MEEQLGDFDRVHSRWPKDLLDEFKRMAPVAVWVGGAKDLVSVTVHHRNGTQSTFGTGNRPCRALKLGWSTYWGDKVSDRINQAPYFEQQLLCRVWVKDLDQAKYLMMAMVQRLTDKSEPTELLKDFIDVGPDYDLNLIGSDFVAAAQESMIEFWSDHALVTHLLAASRRRRERDEKRTGTWDKPLKLVKR